MWFSHKGDAYQIGYAESTDGLEWNRFNNHEASLLPSFGSQEFDSEMVEYGAVLRYKGQLIMLYNGNNYGYDGIGVAIKE